MDELRWILLLIGLAVVGGVYFLGDPRRRERSASERKRDDLRDEDLEHELERLQGVIREGSDARDVQPKAPPPRSSRPSAPAVVNRNPDQVVALFLRPREGDLLQSRVFKAAREAGLDFGELDIFHRINEVGEAPSAVYSLAEICEPGGFDPDAPEGTTVPGLTLFLTLPNALSALDAWDAMLATTQRLADLLDCEIQDESRSTLTRQRIAHVRDQMREYDRKQNLLL